MEIVKKITGAIKDVCLKMKGYALILFVFALFYLFFGDYTIFDRLEYQHKLGDQYREIENYKKEIEECDNTIKYIEKDNETLERYAREIYYMKQPNEDVFLVDE